MAKKAAFVCVLVWLVYVSIAAQVVLRGKWDYADAELPTITRFEVKVDTGNWIAVGIPAPEVFPDTLAGHHTFTYTLPSVANGPHSFLVRACDDVECSFEVSKPFKLIGPAKNPRVER